MQATTWRDRTGLIGRVLDRPHRYDFFQAVHLLDRWLQGQPARHTLESVLRFSNSISLGFPPSQIEALAIDDARIRITPAFIGFLGVKGALPYCYTETIATQVHGDKDESGRAFLDCFSQRSVMLFYRAWEKCRVEYRFGRDGRDDFRDMQLALAGHAGRKDAEEIPAEAVAHYAAVLRQRPVSAALLSAVLNDYFGVPIRLEPFVPAWERLQPDETATLGEPQQCRLGSMIIGKRYRTRDTWVRLWIGPLTRDQYDHFLRDGDGGKALKAMLALFSVPELRFEVRPILRAKDIRPVILGQARLGRAAVLTFKPATRDHDKTRYLIEPF
ncbi:type VI secretion system baseplate subunit TssG [Pseudoduganella sp. SL102]|uniref:type VI secretion system baseplate subunit TssG n=1 Tax=Pseudoduganella sp. SL102 TaxID=2995154 RepID=UPI00248BAB26|nr:type VI secretion system baseplate subunit TssG [Pseudoduganella sp. SL102]WBS03979.1 type VI secretion system baseplate subunit TssG [Pseudoduganella sp. SL102]